MKTVGSSGVDNFMHQNEGTCILSVIPSTGVAELATFVPVTEIKYCVLSFVLVYMFIYVYMLYVKCIKC